MRIVSFYINSPEHYKSQYKKRSVKKVCFNIKIDLILFYPKSLIVGNAHA